MSFAEIYPDPELRHSLLQILAASIRTAHDLEPGAWSVSLRDGGRYVNLIIGRIYLLSLKWRWPSGLKRSVKLELTKVAFA